MICRSEVDSLLYVDGELPADERAAFETHLTDCVRCRQRLAALREESEMLRDVLQEPLPGDAPQPVLTSRGFLWTALSLIAAAAGINVGLEALATLDAQLGWLNPFTLLRPVSHLVDLMFSLTLEDIAMPLTTLAAFTTILMALASLPLVTRRRLSAVAGVLFLVIAAAPTSATEFRPSRDQSGTVLIPAGETVDDTVVAAGKSIVVEGIVTGDLIAFAQRVRVVGEVRGSLIAAARDVTIEGKIGGDSYSASQNLDVSGTIQRNLHAAGADIDITSGASIGRDAFLTCEGGRVNGYVGRDLRASGDMFKISGEVARNVRISGHELNLAGTARIGGDVKANVQKAESFTRSPGAQLAHEPKVNVTGAKSKSCGTSCGFSRWLKPSFYFWQLVWLAAAFGLGLLLYWLVPALFERTAPTARRLLVSAGIGFLALVATPAAAVILALTLVGLPTACIGLGLWGAGLYLSGIFVALVIGQALVRSAQTSTGSFVLTLLVGLALLRILVNLPFLGCLIQFLVIVVGLGLFVAQLTRMARRLRQTSVV